GANATAGSANQGRSRATAGASARKGSSAYAAAGTSGAAAAPDQADRRPASADARNTHAARKIEPAAASPGCIGVRLRRHVHDDQAASTVTAASALQQPRRRVAQGTRSQLRRGSAQEARKTRG